MGLNLDKSNILKCIKYAEASFGGNAYPPKCRKCFINYLMHDITIQEWYDEIIPKKSYKNSCFYIKDMIKEKYHKGIIVCNGYLEEDIHSSTKDILRIINNARLINI